MINHGKLVGHDVVVVSFDEYLSHIRTLGEQSFARDYCVCHDHIGDVMVSTMFLHGVDHSFGGGPSLWFETMALGLRSAHPLHDEQDRYTTWTQAEIGHAEILARVLASIQHWRLYRAIFDGCQKGYFDKVYPTSVNNIVFAGPNAEYAKQTIAHDFLEVKLVEFYEVGAALDYKKLNPRPDCICVKEPA